MSDNLEAYKQILEKRFHSKFDNIEQQGDFLLAFSSSCYIENINNHERAWKFNGRKETCQTNYADYYIVPISNGKLTEDNCHVSLSSCEGEFVESRDDIYFIKNGSTNISIYINSKHKNSYSIGKYSTDLFDIKKVEKLLKGFKEIETWRKKQKTLYALNHIEDRRRAREEKLEGKKLPKVIKDIGKVGIEIDSKIQTALTRIVNKKTKALLLGTAAAVVGAAAITSSNSKKDNKDPEDGKNKKEVVLPPDNKNVIEVEGDIDDAKAAELVKEYKKQHSAEVGKDNNKGQTYYIVVKNSQKQGR
ncbi:MAG: hypothetical protein IJ677_02240 [Alphaproteobacteria bacterium]|nr:hypothetical protein [Alphaproteobacteria bacterium]